MSVTWNVVDTVSTMNAPDVYVVRGNWLPGNMNRGGACVVSSYVTWSNKRG